VRAVGTAMCVCFDMLAVWVNIYKGVYPIWGIDMSVKGHIVYKSNRKTVRHKYRRNTKMGNNQKEVQVKLMKGLLDMIIMQFLNTGPMHGYQIITKIRKSFGVYFGPSTIYPLLSTLEEKGCVISEWNMDSERPRKVYKLTSEGYTMLNFTEDSFNLICRKISATPESELTTETVKRATISPIIPRIGAHPAL
jgi:PadR family transcriptional regulator PadR